jgi:EAL domain-containing protein (putative c-di-GMP-specific phosphodiesterase class I)
MNRGHAILAANKVLGLLKEPFLADGRALDVGACAGVSFFPEHAEDPELLTQRAALAMRHAQSAGNDCETYNFSSSTESTAPLLLERELKVAINSGELMMHYQPQINLKDQTICGVESLLRWESAALGIMNPEVFIPVAERSDLIVSLTQWTLNTSMRNFIESKMHVNDMKISVNLSAALLHDDEIIDIVVGAMSLWGAKPENLVLEITESAIMTNPEKSLEILRRFNEIGIAVSIDDFGTGYSSLSYLKHLPVKEIKIDKSFVISMLDSEDDRKIVRSIIDLAHNFDLNVVAEGIEDQETLSLITEMGCDIGQGYFIGRPMSLDSFQQWQSETSVWKTISDTKTGT